MNSGYNYEQHGGIKEVARLILVSVGNNNNKFWNATLCNDDTIVVYNGRVGGTGQVRPVSARGTTGLAKLIAEKNKKGYALQRVLTTSGSPELKKPAPSNQGELIAAAKRDMLKAATPTGKDKYLHDIIEYLVKSNVHSITGSTSIKFDSVSGVFSTPLGVLTPDAITDAKDLLTKIHAGMCVNKIPEQLVNEYLQIVPQAVGARVNIEQLFGTSAKINAQMQILESLEESIKTLEKRKADEAAAAGDVVVATPKTLFSVSMELEEDASELKWINKFYDSTKNVRSTGNGMKIKTVFKLELTECRKAFADKGKPVGNIQRYWHGTSAANLLSILQNGLRTAPPSTARIAGKAFGNGIYFSDIATKSLGYAMGYWGGSGDRNRAFMLLNNVAMGTSYDPTQTDSCGKWPKNGSNSTFAKGGRVFQNNEMIVYNNYQVDPTHLVEFNG